MRRDMTNIFLDRDSLLEVSGAIEESINGTLIPNLKDIINSIKGEKVISQNVLFSELNLKSDENFFNRLLKVCNNYSKILPKLKQKIDEELPDRFNSNTSNVNIKLATALIGVGSFLAENLNDILMFIIARFYLRSNIDIDKIIVDKIGKQLIFLIKKLPELENAKFETIVDIIGNVPVIGTIRKENTSFIPTDVVTSFMTNTFKIKDRFTLGFIKSIFNSNGNKNVKKIGATGFIYNPIYHIRLLLVDLEELRLEKLKDSKRLLELRLIELKNRAKQENDPKIEQAIKYYEDKLEKINRKIERYLEG